MAAQKGYRACMYLGRVIGTVVATQKVEKLAGMKLLLVQPDRSRAQADARTRGRSVTPCKLALAISFIWSAVARRR